jgi:hypothetical protein
MRMNSISIDTQPHVRSRDVWFRAGALLFAILLGAQCAWLLLANLTRSDVTRLPTDANAAAAATAQRAAAGRAAAIGAIRGDLWADLAFTHANLLWLDADANPGAPQSLIDQSLTDARAALGRALGAAPHNSDAWLLLAGLAARYPSSDFDATKALKMSYYTGPSEQDLIPLRLRIAAHSDFVGDFEMSQFVTRDLRFLLLHNQQSVVVATYKAASPAGKSFIERVVSEIAPSALPLLHAAVQAPELPN